MDDTTTTDAPVETGGQVINGVAVDDQGMAVPEPETTTETAPAEPETTEPEQESGEPEHQSEQTEPSDEEQLAKFAETKGLTLDSDNAKKAAKMAMEAEKRMHSATKKASELEKATNITEDDITDVPPAEQNNWRIRNVELKMDIRDWKHSNPDKIEHEDAMVKVLQHPVKKQLVQSGYLSLDDVYSIALAGNTDAVKSQAKRDTLKTLAQNQQAAVPRGNAVNPSGGGAERITPKNVDAMVAKMSVEEYQKRLPEINAAMAG